MTYKEIKKCGPFYLLPFRGDMLPCNTKEGAFALLKALNQSGECALNAIDIFRATDVDWDGLGHEWTLYYQCGSFHIQEVTIYPNKERVETYSKPFEFFDEAWEETEYLDWEIVY